MPARHMSYANGRRRAIRLPEALKRSNTANAELPLPLIWTQGTGCLPPTGSTAGFALLCNPYMVYTINRKHG